MRRRSRYSINWRFLLTILSLGGLVYLTLKIPPEEIWVVGIYALNFSLFAYLLSTFFLAKKFSLIIAVTILAFLVMNYFIGFQIINTLLLVSFMIGIAFLLK